MSALRLDPAGWPPHPHLRQRRWAQRLLVGLTDELDALGCGHSLLVDLLARVDGHSPEGLAHAIAEVDYTLVSPTDTAELLDLARPLPDVATLLRRACQLRTRALSRMRRLLDIARLRLPLTFEHTRAVLDQARGDIADAGQALAQADHALVTVLKSTPDKEVPATVRHTNRHPHPGTDWGISVSDTGEFRRALSADQIASLTARLQRSRAHQPVSDEHTRHLAARWRQLHERLHASDIVRHQQLTETRARLVADREDAEQQLVRLKGRIDSHRGGLGRWRNRHELADLDHDREVTSRWLERIEAGVRQVDAELSDLPNQQQIARLRDEYREVTSHLHRRAAQRVAGFERACPTYVAAAIGTPPTQRRLREAWQRSALAIEQYRLRWNVTDALRPLGPEPADPLDRQDHRWAVMQIQRTRHELDREPTRERSHGRGLGLSR